MPAGEAIEVAEAIEELVEVLPSRPSLSRAGVETDQQLLELWLSVNPRAPQTIQIYWVRAQAFLQFLVEQGLTLRTCTLADLHRWQQALPAHEAPATRRLRLSVVRSLLSFAHATGYTPFNVGAALRPERWVRAQMITRFLTPEELQRLSQAADEPTRVLIELLYGTGARISELCQMRWEQVTWEGQAARLLIHGKGQRDRVVRLPPNFTAGLRTLYGTGQPPEAFVLAGLTRKGLPLDRRAAFHLIRRAAKAAGLTKRISPHWLRHSHVTHAVNAGAPLHLVQATVGHASLATTGRYLHADPQTSSGDYLEGIKETKET